MPKLHHLTIPHVKSSELISAWLDMSISIIDRYYIYVYVYIYIHTYIYTQIDNTENSDYPI